ncbi:hypothetical protein [Acidisoma sp. C75]
MSGFTTVSGGTTPTQFTTSGAGPAFSSAFSSGTTYTNVTGSGSISTSGPVIISGSGTTVSVSGASAVADTSAGGNRIVTSGNTRVFAAANDTIAASSGASTLFGASSGLTQFSVSGANSSVVGGSGGFLGTVTGGNSTLVGGSGVSVMTVTGRNNLVAGGTGVTSADLRQSAGGNVVSTNPLGNSGTLIANLGAGAATVVGGSGTSYVAGNGSDVFLFIKGHAGGSEYIYGFNSSDNIGFGGYGYSAANLPTEQVGALGDVITLNDGTKITLVGVNHTVF